ncbi:MAG: TspO/MBR family protein [Verrucomicrobiota bacterium]
MKLWVKILVFVVVANLLGGLGAIVTVPAIADWYETLTKPPAVPPNQVFGPTWTVLYAMIGASLAIFLHRVPSSPAKRLATVWFSVQMVLNLIWSPIFFGAHWMGIGLIVLVSLWIALLVTILKFFPLDRLAGALLIPYFLWVSYATYLNAGYWWLNR